MSGGAKENAKALALLQRLSEMKLAAYGKHYGKGVSPIDAYDDVALHVLLCERTPSGELIPLAGFKSVSLQRADECALPFPALSILEDCEAWAHLEQLQRILAECRRQGVGIAYDGSMAVEPSLGLEKATLLTQLLGLVVHTHRDVGNSELIGLGIKQVGAERYWHRAGFAPMTVSGEPLPDIQPRHLRGHTAEVMHLKRFSPRALSYAERYESLWRERITM